jgi:hypothetical protein
MGYELHIKRKHEENPIMIEEWLDYIRNDKELTYTKGIEVKLPNGMSLGMSGEGMAIWKTTFDEEELELTFLFRNGEISARFIEDFQILKMKEIANKLGAIVVGDEGERY